MAKPLAKALALALAKGLAKALRRGPGLKAQGPRLLQKAFQGLLKAFAESVKPDPSPSSGFNMRIA